MDIEGSRGINISSIIVGASPSHADAVQAALQALDGVEVHAATEDGRMIVSIESGTEDNTVNTFETIRQLPGVLSASLVYHQFESDPDEEA